MDNKNKVNATGREGALGQSEQSNIPSDSQVDAVPDAQTILSEIDGTAEANIFAEDIKPKRPWYKFWGLYVYLVIFITSLVVLAVYVDTTNKIFDTLSVDTVSDSILDSIVDISFTKVPGLEEGSNIDVEITNELLRFVEGPSFGNPDAPIVIFEFSDFQCPFCRQAFPTIKQVLTKYSDSVRFVYLDFPLDSIHPLAVQAAQAGHCADEQGMFWQYHDSLFQNQDKLDENLFSILAGLNGLDTDAFDECISSNKYLGEIQQQFDLGRELGVIGTPTFFVNGHRIPGVIPFETWTQIIDVILYGVPE